MALFELCGIASTRRSGRGVAVFEALAASVQPQHSVILSVPCPCGQVLNIIISFVTPVINAFLESSLTGLVAWEHNTSDDETATRLMYGVFQTQVRVCPQ